MDVKDVMDNIASIKKGENKDGKSFNKIRGTVAGGIIGGLGGLMMGYSAKWNLFYSAVIGIAIGGVASIIFIPRD